MEVITIESKAFAALVEKIDGIAAYVEESRQRELDGQQGQEEKNSRTTGKWMTGSEVCEYLEISPRTLQRYRTNRIIAFSICGKKIRYRRTDVEQFRERWMRETPDKQIDRMIEQHPLHERKYKLYGKKRGNTGKDEYRAGRVPPLPAREVAGRQEFPEPAVRGQQGFVQRVL